MRTNVINIFENVLNSVFLEFSSSKFSILNKINWSKTPMQRLGWQFMTDFTKVHISTKVANSTI